MISRRVEVQRWPAVPTAPKKALARAPVRSALSLMMMALLPPSSRMARPRRAPTTPPMRWPMRVEPVALIRGTWWSLTSFSPMVEPRPMVTQLMPSGSPLALKTSFTMFWQAIAHSGRLARGLPQAAVAADPGQGRVPGPHRDREVEGADDADHAQGMPLLHHAVLGPLALQGRAAQVAAQADGEVADVDHLLHLAQTLGVDLAHLQADQGAEHVLLGAQGLAHLPHDLAALGRRQFAPDQEGLAGLLHDLVVVLGAGLFDAWPGPRRWWDSPR